MKKLSILITLTALGYLFAQDTIRVESQPVAATVFRDCAMVMREGERNISAGLHTIVFSDLTNELDDESVQASARAAGTVRILDVKVETRYTAKIRRTELQAFQRKMDDLQNELQAVSDRIAVLESKKDFVEALKAESVKNGNQQLLSGKTMVKDWSAMLAFVDQNLNEIYAGLRQSNLQKKAIQEKIRELQINQNLTRSSLQQEYKEIIIHVESKRSVKMTIQTRYMVPNAGWYPLYDARVSSAEKQAEIAYYGMVRQNTGEDWHKIALTLSTAEPMTSRTIPVLPDWYLDFKPLVIRGGRSAELGGSGNISYQQNWGLPRGTGAVSGRVLDVETDEPLPGVNIFVEGTHLGTSSDQDGSFSLDNIPAGHCKLKFEYVGYQKAVLDLLIVEKNQANIRFELTPSTLELGEVVSVVAERPMINKDEAFSKSVWRKDDFEAASAVNRLPGVATVSAPEPPSYGDAVSKELSTVFELPVKYTIPSDAQPHKVTIAIARTPVEFAYTAMPGVVQSVFLKGNIRNEQDYPWLDGEINIFMDEDFVNRAVVNTVMPTDSLALALGIDPAIQVEKKLINKFTESKGFTGSRNRITFEYEITVTNNRKTGERVKVVEQWPLSRNEDITVDRLSPEPDTKQKKEESRVVWILNLASGQQQKLVFKFAVEYPKDRTVFGLN